jgi:hypothetical protein
MPTNSRITIFVGNYGSGKTEFSMNYALELAKKGQKTAFVDLDIINPYFRSREMASTLADNGVYVILPQVEYVMSEAPALPAEIEGYIGKEDYHLVIDVGGDNTGATALGRFSELINNKGYNMCMVVNTNRPDTSTPTGVVTVLKSIEVASGLKVTALIHNTNLAWDTDLQLIKEGQQIINQAARLSELPVAYTVVERRFYNQALKELPNQEIFPIDILMRLQWAQT